MKQNNSYEKMRRRKSDGERNRKREFWKKRKTVREKEKDRKRGVG